MALAGPHVMRSAPSVSVYPSGALSITRQLLDSNTSIDHSYYHYSSPRSLSQTVMSAGMGTFRTYSYHQDASLSNSQTSVASLPSEQSTTSTRSLMVTSSDNSQKSILTDNTSPLSRLSTSSMKEGRNGYTSARAMPRTQESAGLASGDNGRFRTPEEQMDASTRDDITSSPMIMTTPVNGVKRTANGIVKNGPISPTSPANITPNGRLRAESVSSSSSKAGEAAANLKTRLAYAMAKVQHGWEHKNMAEVEQLAASMSPRTLASPRGERMVLSSPRSTILNDKSKKRLPSTTIPLYDPYASSKAPMSPPAKRRSSVLNSAPAMPKNETYSTLAPPVELDRHTQARRVSFHKPTTSQSKGVPASPSSRMPTTPKSSRRPASIRTSTQTAQDEQDAMAALLLMGSPSNGGNLPRGSQHSSGSVSPAEAQSLEYSTPRQTIKHRTASFDSLSKSSESVLSSIDSADRGAILDQIEAE